MGGKHVATKWRQGVRGAKTEGETPPGSVSGNLILETYPKLLAEEQGEYMRLARALAIAVGLVLVWSVVAQAQAQNKPAQFVQLTITTVRPSVINDYEDFVKKLNAARDKTSGSPRVLVYAVNLRGPAFTFYT